jgi:hypothetical protein
LRASTAAAAAVGTAGRRLATEPAGVKITYEVGATSEEGASSIRSGISSISTAAGGASGSTSFDSLFRKHFSAQAALHPSTDGHVLALPASLGFSTLTADPPAVYTPADSGSSTDDLGKLAEDEGMSVGEQVGEGI